MGKNHIQKFLKKKKQKKNIQIQLVAEMLVFYLIIPKKDQIHIILL